MLKLIVLGDEYYNEETETFSTVGDVTLELEHSLVSVSKWESKFERAFLSSKSKTPEEIFEYIKAMIVTPDVESDIIYRFDKENLDKINAYLDSKQSATTFGAMPERRGRGEVITSELIYYWMIAFTIPFECQYWHLNRLFALIRICNLKNAPQKKMSRHEIATRNRALNEQRRAELNTTG
jgi:hypothetical protein